MKISIIAAVAENGAIGYKENLIYKIPRDLQRFKSLTLGHPVIMGRTTWESLPSSGLSGRKNIILTHHPDYQANISSKNEVICATSLEEAIKLCEGEEEVFIIGGANVYKQAIPVANKLYLTLIHDSPIAGKADTFFPIEWINKFYNHQIKRTDWYENDVRFSFIDYEV